MTLTDKIKDKKNTVSFHTPGHSGKLDNELIDCDITELSYSDNLLNPTGDILALENQLASVFKAEACFISTNGATNSIFQAIYATKAKGDFLLCGDIHVSVYNALRITGATAYHIDYLNTSTEIPESVKVVVVTSPDYFGMCGNIAEISQICKDKQLTLIIDASHGSHFVFSPLLPDDAVKYGDLVIYSLHKTLPVATGGSVLCVKEEYRNICTLARKIFHSTSPSYITLCSIDNMVKDFTEKADNYYNKIAEEIRDFSQNLKNGFEIKYTDDFTRLVISGKYYGKSLTEKLLNVDIAVEMGYENCIVCIVTPYNYKFLDKLARELNDIDDCALYEKTELNKTTHVNAVKLCFDGEAEFVEISYGVGRLAFNEIGFYPPGVPLLYSHQKITKEDVTLLLSNVNSVFSLVNGRLPVVK